MAYNIEIFYMMERKPDQGLIHYWLDQKIQQQAHPPPIILK